MSNRSIRNRIPIFQDPSQRVLTEKEEEEIQLELLRRRESKEEQEQEQEQTKHSDSSSPSPSPSILLNLKDPSEERIDLEFALNFDSTRRRSSNSSSISGGSQIIGLSLERSHPSFSSSSSSFLSSSTSSSSNASNSTSTSNRTVKSSNSIHPHLHPHPHPLAQAQKQFLSPQPSISYHSIHFSDPNPTEYSERFQDDPLVPDTIENRRPVSLYSPINSTSNPLILPNLDHEKRSIHFKKGRSKDHKTGILFTGERVKSTKENPKKIPTEDKGRVKQKERFQEPSSSSFDTKEKISKETQSIPSLPSPPPLIPQIDSDSIDKELEPETEPIQQRKRGLTLINPEDRGNLFISNSLAKAFDKSRSLIEIASVEEIQHQQKNSENHSIESSSSSINSSIESETISKEGKVKEEEEGKGKTEMDPGLGIIGIKNDSTKDSNSKKQSSSSSVRHGSIRRPSFAFWERARKSSSTNDGNDGGNNRGRSNSSISNNLVESKNTSRDRSDVSSSPEFILTSVEGRNESLERLNDKIDSNSNDKIGTGMIHHISQVGPNLDLGLENEIREKEKEKEIGFSSSSHSSSNEDEMFSNLSENSNPTLIRTNSSSSSSSFDSFSNSNFKIGNRNRSRGDTLPSFSNPIVSSNDNLILNEDSKKEFRSRSASTSTFKINNGNGNGSSFEQLENDSSKNSSIDSNDLKIPSSSSSSTNSKHIHLHRSALAIERYSQDDDNRILSLFNGGKEYDSDSDSNNDFSIDSNLSFNSQTIGGGGSSSRHTRSQSEDQKSTNHQKENSIKDLARVKRRRKLLKNQISIARKGNKESDNNQNPSTSNNINGRRRSASSVTQSTNSLSLNSNFSSSSRMGRSSSVSGNINIRGSLRETEDEGGDEAELYGNRKNSFLSTKGGVDIKQFSSSSSKTSASVSKPISLEEELESQIDPERSSTETDSNKLNSSLNIDDRAYTPSIISSAGDDSFYDATERGSGNSSSSSTGNRSETDEIDNHQDEKIENNLITSKNNHGLRSSRRKFNTSTSNSFSGTIGLGIEDDVKLDENLEGNQQEIEQEDEEGDEDEDEELDENGNRTLNRKKTISPMVYVATSSATLRQEARALDQASSNSNTSRSSSYDTEESLGLVKEIESSSVLERPEADSSSSSTISSTSSPNFFNSSSPSSWNLKSLRSENHHQNLDASSPISSNSNQSFSPSFPVVTTPSSSRMFVRTSSLRSGSRTVPPLKPSPTSPLPPPPPSAPGASIDSSNHWSGSSRSNSNSRPLSGVSIIPSEHQLSKDQSQKTREMDEVVSRLNNLGKGSGSNGGNSRSRSQSLGQASQGLVGLDDQMRVRPSINQLSNSNNLSNENHRNRSSSFMTPPALSRTTSTDSSNRRNRSSSNLPPTLNLHGSLTNPIPSPLSTSRPRPLSSTSEEIEPGKPFTSSVEEKLNSSKSVLSSNNSLDRGATIRGRPRGATIGAVPYSGSNHHPNSRISAQTKSRPRSLLSNEILIPDSVRAEWEREAREKSSEKSSSLSNSNSNSNSNNQSNVVSPSDSPSIGSGSIEKSLGLLNQNGRVNSSNSIISSSSSRSFGDDYLSNENADTSASTSASGNGGTNTNPTSSPGSYTASGTNGGGATSTSNGNNGTYSGNGGGSERSDRSRSGSNSNGNPSGSGSGSGSGRDRDGGGNRSRSGSNASLLQQVQHPPKSHASFVIAVVGHRGTGKSTVIKKGLRQFGLSKPNVLSEKVTSHSTVCVVDQEQRTIEVLEIDASVLLNAPGKRFAWPKFLPRIDAVILCYDAGQISSFRGMSELLDNFAQGHLSTVMLACKSEIFPKQVDPYYASDMAAVYNVGLAECTVQSEEGKKRMRDCFSYLVKEVAKARAGKQRKANASPSQQQSSREKEREKETSPDRRNRAGSSSSAPSNPSATQTGELLDSSVSVHSAASSSHGSLSSTRDRNNSGASSTGGSVPSAASFSSSGVPHFSEENTATIPQNHHQLQQQHYQAQSRSNEALSETERYRNMRKMSDATTASDAPSFPESNSEEDHAVQQSISKAQLGLQSAQSAGGYVSIDELWDKFFFAAVSGNDERFLLMFMVFYRGFAKPIDLLRQLIERFDKLAISERSDGVMIRFSLMRLTNMLGEWIQDYPGDLSGPETYPVVCSFYQKLLQHPSTVHVASPLQPHLEAVRYAPDVDAVWSKMEDSDKPQSVAADVAPISTMISPELSGSATSLPKPPSTKSVNSSGSIPSVSSPPPPLPGQEEDGSEGRTRSRGQSDASSFGPPIDNAHLSPKPMEGRHRSASDVTSSSSDGIRGPHSVAGTSMTGSVVTASSVSIAPSTVSSNPTVDRSPSEQKTLLRGVSNALGEMDDEAIAGELTRLEWNLFTAIRPRDLLRHILVARDLREKNGPVARSIAHFNYISFWVCSVILVQGKTKHRAKMLEKFMNIAAILRRDNNYNTLHSVLAGLGNASVHRLKHTRELLNGKPVIKTYQSLARLMGSDRSFAAYRLALDNSESRTIPYLGVHLQDILSMSDGNPSKRSSDGMVHWRKFSLMDEAVMAIVKCQQHDRPTRPNHAVERLIMDLPVMDEEALYQRSLEVEPRSSQPSKIKKLMMQGTAS